MSSTCPSCGSSGVYNSGFTVECPNEACQFFSEKQRVAIHGEPVVEDLNFSLINTVHDYITFVAEVDGDPWGLSQEDLKELVMDPWREPLFLPTSVKAKAAWFGAWDAIKKLAKEMPIQAAPLGFSAIEGPIAKNMDDMIVAFDVETSTQLEAYSYEVIKSRTSVPVPFSLKRTYPMSNLDEEE